MSQFSLVRTSKKHVAESPCDSNNEIWRPDNNYFPARHVPAHTRQQSTRFACLVFPSQQLADQMIETRENNYYFPADNELAEENFKIHIWLLPKSERTNERTK